MQSASDIKRDYEAYIYSLGIFDAAGSNGKLSGAPIATINTFMTDVASDSSKGYWYYDKVLPAGKKTETELNIKYTFPSVNDKPEEFNIVVIQECTPVLYDENGNPVYDFKDDSTQTTE